MRLKNAAILITSVIIMTIPSFLELQDPVDNPDDIITNNDMYFPNLSQAEFEQNYQITDVFQAKTRYMLLTAMLSVNSQANKVVGQNTIDEVLKATYRMCVYACAMMMTCQRYGSVDTQSKEEFIAERKSALALEYKNEYRRLLLILNGNGCEVT